MATADGPARAHGTCCYHPSFSLPLLHTANNADTVILLQTATDAGARLQAG